MSKAILDEELIPTPNGFVKAKDLRVGDYVFGSDGKPARILDIPYIGNDECYEFLFGDGTSIISSKDHEWIAKDSERRFRKTHSQYDQWGVFSTSEIYKRGGYELGSPRAKMRFCIPVCEPVEYLKRSVLPVEPYFLGLIIGDGCTRSNALTITNPEPEITDYLLSIGCRKRKEDNRCPVFALPNIRPQLKALGLMGLKSCERFIPEEYLRASIEDRKRLLWALMDTDGTASNGSVYSYCTTSARLADDFSELVCSLGGKVRVHKRKTGYKKSGKFVRCLDAYIIYVTLNFCPFSLPRKSAGWHECRYKNERVIRDVLRVGKRQVRCFTVASHDSSFLISRNYIVTHNSSTQIRKCIHWATDKSMWNKLWPGKNPTMFWYYYPNFDLATVEFEQKWVKEFLPRDEFKRDPIYGWEEEYDGAHINAVRFFSGVTVYFKAYTQKLLAHSASTVYAVFADEEMPEALYGEITFRLAATDGYFNKVFTNTLNQMFWWRVIEGRGDSELLPDAFKVMVSAWDCLVYEDGSPSPWTEERIKRMEAGCKSENEKLRRIYGRYVADDSTLQYPTFDPVKHFISPRPIPSNWHHYAAVDPGSGGKRAHPAAVVFVAVNPEGTLAYLYKAWRGDGVVTTAADILEKYRQLRGSTNVTLAAYDFSAKDFGILAERCGESFLKADKDRASGEEMLSTLLHGGMIYFFDEPEIRKIGTELLTLKRGTDKAHAADDLCDALKYCCKLIPWDYSKIGDGSDKLDVKSADPERPLTHEERIAKEIEERRARFVDETHTDELGEEFASEIGFWNEQYGS